MPKFVKVIRSLTNIGSASIIISKIHDLKTGEKYVLCEVSDPGFNNGLPEIIQMPIKKVRHTIKICTTAT